MTKQDMAKEILEVFFCACSESFDYSLQKQSTMDPGELMALPLMWVQHTHGNMLEDMLEVEFTPAPESRYGFKVHSVVIHNEVQVHNLLFDSGNMFTKVIWGRTWHEVSHEFRNSFDSHLKDKSLSIDMVLKRVFDEFTLDFINYQPLERVKRAHLNDETEVDSLDELLRGFGDAPKKSMMEVFLCSLSYRRVVLVISVVTIIFSYWFGL